MQEQVETMRRGVFITLEGIDGTGKSTQLRRLVHYLRKRGCRVQVTREPGGTRTGEQVRGILLASKTGKLVALAELALMYAARAELLEEVVRPALERGEWVVSDRYNTASFAYQGFGRELGIAAVRAFDRIICGNTQPDLTIILDLIPEQAMRRARGRETRRQSRPDRFESQGLEFHRRVRAGYLAIARTAPRRIKVLRADQPIEKLQQEIRVLVEPWLPDRPRGNEQSSE
jgi:dTMP kinase